MLKLTNKSEMVKNKKSARYYLVRIVLSMVILALLGALWIGYSLMQIRNVKYNPAIVTYKEATADAGIILGASMRGDKPSYALIERLDLGLEQYEAGKFEYFIVTGGLDSPEFPYTQAEGMAQYLEEHGVPQEKILLENKATSTYENLKYSKRIMDEHQLASAIIVTHRFHGNRSYEIAKALKYSDPKLALAETRVLAFKPNITREVLAYTKWKLDHFLLFIGLK